MMGFGINGTGVLDIKNLTSIANVTEPIQFFQNVNNVIFDGWLYFIILGILGVIIFFGLNQKNDQLMVNLMYSGAILTILSFFMRAMSLINDFHMWMIIIVTIILALINYAIKD